MYAATTVTAKNIKTGRQRDVSVVFRSEDDGNVAGGTFSILVF